MVMGFNNQTHLFHDHTHGGTDVLRRVYWRNREVTPFHARTVTFVTAFVFGRGVPRTFNVIDRDMGAGDRGTKADVVEQEEFWFWPEQDGISDAGGAQVLFSAFRDGARVTVIALQGAWLEDIAADDQGRFFVERVNDRGGRVRHQDHVRFVDTFQPPIEEPSNILPSSKNSAFT